MIVPVKARTVSMGTPFLCATYLTIQVTPEFESTPSILDVAEYRNNIRLTLIPGCGYRIDPTALIVEKLINDRHRDLLGDYTIDFTGY